MLSELAKELVLRRLQSERQKGTPIEEIFDLIRQMLASQRLANEYKIERVEGE